VVSVDPRPDGSRDWTTRRTTVGDLYPEALVQGAPKSELWPWLVPSSAPFVVGQNTVGHDANLSILVKVSNDRLGFPEGHTGQERGDHAPPRDHEVATLLAFNALPHGLGARHPLPIAGTRPGGGDEPGEVAVSVTD